MSISFTPSQTHVLHQCLIVSEACPVDDLRFEALCELRALVSTILTREGFEWPCPQCKALHLERGDGCKACLEVDREIEGKARLVSRAYARFRREFAAYQTHRGVLSAVRQYHALLIDTLAPFIL